MILFAVFCCTNRYTNARSLKSNYKDTVIWHYVIFDEKGNEYVTHKKIPHILTKTDSQQLIKEAREEYLKLKDR